MKLWSWRNGRLGPRITRGELCLSYTYNYSTMFAGLISHPHVACFLIPMLYRNIMQHLTIKYPFNHQISHFSIMKKALRTSGPHQDPINRSSAFGSIVTWQTTPFLGPFLSSPSSCVLVSFGCSVWTTLVYQPQTKTSDAGYMLRSLQKQPAGPAIYHVRSTWNVNMPPHPTLPHPTPPHQHM